MNSHFDAPVPDEIFLACFIIFNMTPVHSLTPEMNAHSFRYFLPKYSIVICSCMYHACMHEQITIGYLGRKYLNECTPFSHVRLCVSWTSMLNEDYLDY